MTMKLSIAVLGTQGEAAAEILAHLLADESFLYTKTKNYYRNAVGHDLLELPEILESQCKWLEEIVREVVERVRPLEGIVPKILVKFLEHPRLNTQGQEDADARTMIANLLAEHKSIIRSLRADLGMVAARGCDMEISDFLKELMEEHQEAVWTLCSLMEERVGLIGRASTASGPPHHADGSRTLSADV
jgi:starvation-inducible DNA-binding protein